MAKGRTSPEYQSLTIIKAEGQRLRTKFRVEKLYLVQADKALWMFVEVDGPIFRLLAFGNRKDRQLFKNMGER